MIDLASEKRIQVAQEKTKANEIKYVYIYDCFHTDSYFNI